MNGIVKWFDTKKGYGFISPNDGGKDVFFHFSALKMEGFKNIKEGTSVEFEVIECKRGLQAAHVVEG